MGINRRTRLAEMINLKFKSLVSKLGIVGLEIDPKLAATLPGLRVSSGVIVAAKAAEPSVDTSLNTGDVIHAHPLCRGRLGHA